MPLASALNGDVRRLMRPAPGVPAEVPDLLEQSPQALQVEAESWIHHLAIDGPADQLHRRRIDHDLPETLFFMISIPKWAARRMEGHVFPNLVNQRI